MSAAGRVVVAGDVRDIWPNGDDAKDAVSLNAGCESGRASSACAVDDRR